MRNITSNKIIDILIEKGHMPPLQLESRNFAIQDIQNILLEFQEENEIFFKNRINFSSFKPSSYSFNK